MRSSLGADLKNVEQILSELEPVKNKILNLAKPAFEIAEKLSSIGNVMFEGAQGALLDVTFGTFPFVTSSNTMIGQVALGSCLGVADLHKTIGVLKAYTTRVGSGPFPTELSCETGKFLRIE